MIGRKIEQNQIESLYNSNKSEFVAIYGRRRVGKTYLVDETLKGRITFRHAGVSPVEFKGSVSSRQAETSSVEVKGSMSSPLKIQLEAFYYSLLIHGMKKNHCPKDWMEAFFMLETYLQSVDDGERMVVFLDELPWMDTAKSGFITAFESFWNSWGCHKNNLMVIVCGSATSWIMDKLINNHGGLYGRITREIKLEPFTLKDCESLLLERNVKISRYDIVQAYMIFGGIPFYLNYIDRGASLAQNVDKLFYSKNAVLKVEYDRLFASVFKNPDLMKCIVEFLSSRSAGFNRREISEYVGLSNGGALTEALSALMVSDFVLYYIPFGQGKREGKYKLVDPFCLFYLKFVKNSDSLNVDFWKSNSETPSIISWRGFAFENVCFNHIASIKKALGISGVSTKYSGWSKRGGESTGLQVDLIIERSDNVINMCEIKFYGDDFVVDKNYDKLLRSRRLELEKIIPKKSVIHNTLITTYGLKDNEYRWVFEKVITMEDLFD